MAVIIGIAFSIIVLLVLSFFYRLGKPVNASLSDAYYFHAWKTKIVYSPMGNWFELGYREMDADPASFTVLSKEFAKDISNGKGKRQRVDHMSFSVDKNQTPKDKHYVYYEPRIGDTLLIIEGADPQSYRLMISEKSNYYQSFAADDRSLFVDGKKFEADRATFKILNKTLAVDSNFIYGIKFNLQLLAGDPGATTIEKKIANPGGPIKEINENYVCLGNLILLSNWKNEFASIPVSSVENIRVIDERNIVVDNQLVSDGKIISAIDVASLEIIDRDFLKDKRSVFYDTQKIAEADPASFVVIFEYYSKDKHHVFYKEKILVGVNPNNFDYDFATGIASDGNVFFKDGEAVKNQ